jgi:hypothetical protein
MLPPQSFYQLSKHKLILKHLELNYKQIPFCSFSPVFTRAFIWRFYHFYNCFPSAEVAQVNALG